MTTNNDLCTKAGAFLFSSCRKYCALVYQNESQRWGLPKGGLECGEDPESGMIREVEEETGLVLGKLPYKSLHVTQVWKCMVYIIHLNSTVPGNQSKPKLKTKDSREIGDVRWVPVTEVKYLTLNRLTRKTLTVARQYGRTADSSNWRTGSSLAKCGSLNLENIETYNCRSFQAQEDSPVSWRSRSSSADDKDRSVENIRVSNRYDLLASDPDTLDPSSEYLEHFKSLNISRPPLVDIRS